MIAGGRNLGPSRTITASPGAVERRAALELERMERGWRDWSVMGMRARLQRTVCHVSPVLVDVAARAAMEVDEVLGMLRPAVPTGGQALVSIAEARRQDRLPFARRRGRGVGPAPDSAGPLTLDDWDPPAVVAIAVRGAAVDVWLRMGGTTLVTSGAGGHLVLPSPIPATLAMAVVGEPLDRVVAHPLLFGRGYVVTSATPWFGRARLGVDFGLVSHPMPWPTLLACDADPFLPRSRPAASCLEDELC